MSAAVSLKKLGAGTAKAGTVVSGTPGHRVIMSQVSIACWCKRTTHKQQNASCALSLEVNETRNYVDKCLWLCDVTSLGDSPHQLMPRLPRDPVPLLHAQYLFLHYKDSGSALLSVFLIMFGGWASGSIASFTMNERATCEQLRQWDAGAGVGLA